MTTKFKIKGLRRHHKDGMVKHHWSEIYRLRYGSTLARDLLWDRICNLILSAEIAVVFMMLISLHPLVKSEIGFPIVVLVCVALILGLFIGVLAMGSGDRLTRFVDDLRTIAEWSDVEPAVILATPEPRMLSLATGIISKAAAELVLYESARPAPRNRMWFWYQEHRRLAVAFNTRFMLFGKLMLVSESDWGMNLDAGRYLIEAGEFPPRSSPAA